VPANFYCEVPANFRIAKVTANETTKCSMQFSIADPSDTHAVKKAWSDESSSLKKGRFWSRWRPAYCGSASGSLKNGRLSNAFWVNGAVRSAGQITRRKSSDETTMAMARTIREMRINFRALGEAVEPIVQNERGRIMWFSAGGHRGAERGQNGS